MHKAYYFICGIMKIGMPKYRKNGQRIYALFLQHHQMCGAHLVMLSRGNLECLVLVINSIHERADISMQN